MERYVFIAVLSARDEPEMPLWGVGGGGGCIDKHEFYVASLGIFTFRDCFAVRIEFDCCCFRALKTSVVEMFLTILNMKTEQKITKLDF